MSGAAIQAPDPRPLVAHRDAGWVVVGSRCSACGYPSAYRRPRCPLCAASNVEAEHGPEGVVWSSTVVRIPIPGREPPYALAYVDLTEGPRMLAHLDGERALSIGTRTKIVGLTETGDILVEACS